MRKTTTLGSLLGAALLCSISAHASLVKLDFRSGAINDTTNFHLSYAVGDSDVTAVFTADLPKTVGGIDSKFLTTGTDGSNGMSITGGVDNADFDNGETFRLTAQLYTGYTDITNRGTEVTGDYTITALTALMRVRTVGDYGLALINTVGGVGTSTNFVTPEADGVGNSNATADYDFADLTVTSPLIVTSIGAANGAPYVQELQTIDFDIFGGAIPEVLLDADLSTDSIILGEPTTLSWTVVTNLDSLAVSPAIGGETDLLPYTTNGVGSIVDYPTSNTTYTVIANRGAVSATNTLSVTVSQLEIVSFNVPTNAYEGIGFPLSWDVTGAAGITITEGATLVHSSSDAAGSVAVTNTLGSHTYVLTATNNLSAPVSSTGTVVVAAAPVPVLIGHWDFEDQTTANKGTTGPDFNGTIIGTGLYTTDTPANLTNSTYALDISTSNSLMYVTNTVSGDPAYNGLFDGNTFSVSFWINQPADIGGTSDDAWLGFANKGDQGNNGWCVRKRANTANIRAQVEGNYGEATGIIDGNWHHVVMTLTAGTVLNVYVDGAIENENVAVSYTPNTAWNLMFGAQNISGVKSTTGFMDDIRYYDNILNPSHVTTLYNGGEIDGSGGTIPDYSMTVTGGSGVLNIGTAPMLANKTYTLQGSDSLVNTNWVTIATTTGVVSVDWVVPTTNDVQFLRTIAE